MATQRYISTSFWDDSWIRKRDPSERYVYLYLLTNPLTNIAGVYKTTIDRISFDTGYEPKIIETVFKRFSADGKAYFFKDFVILPSWPKHQKAEQRAKVKAGIEAILRELPPEIIKYLKKIGYRYPIDTLSIPYTYDSNYLDSDSDSDSEFEPDTDTDLTRAPSAAAEPQQEPDDFYFLVKRRFEEKQPLRVSKNGEKKPGFDNYGKEGKAIHGLIEKARARSPDSPGEFLEAMIQIFEALRRTDKFYKGHPFLPSALNSSGIWDRVLSEAQSRWEEEEQSREFNPITEGIVF